MASYIKIKLKFKKEKEVKKCAKTKKGAEEWLERALEVRHDLILGFCRDPKQITISGYGTCLLADDESIDDILKRQEDAEKAEELSRFDFSAEAMREGVRRATKDGSTGI
jgi:hypothetical protein